MGKTKNRSAERAKRSATVEVEKPGTSDPGAWSRTARETVESVVIAFVLAFLFRTFEAEAFVIPTGSMAPTLMGRHMDLNCPKCGYHYQVGGPDDDSTPKGNNHYGLCPMCGYRLPPSEDARYYNGDRILVNKFAFDFTPPKRWDVIVFKYPEDAKTNYIKRLIGLPGEVVRIRDGDIGISLDGGKTFEYARKEPAKLRAILQMVYDNDFVYEPFLARGWPARWRGEQGWANPKRDDGALDPKVFVADGKLAGANSAEIAWLRYFNDIPTETDWEAFDAKQPLNPNPRVEPISDFNPYDESARRMGNASGHEIVSDLAIECEVNIEQAAGKLAFRLSKAGRPFECQLDLATGGIALAIPDQAAAEPPRSNAGISTQGRHRLLFANVDHQLTLSIDGKPVQFDKPTVYNEFYGEKQADSQFAERGESPVQIGVQGASLRIEHLRVLRDIYYTYGQQNRATDVTCFPESALSHLREVQPDIRPYDQYYFVGKEGDGSGREDQFFPLGDNSPSSADGRYWRTEHFVDRRLMVGKALFIYWPHSFDKIRLSDDHSIPFPFFPNFGRMGFVR